MARIRSVKPGFFLNEELAGLPYQWRLLFIGLWTQADRDGRLEDRPMRLKAALFPYDDLNIDEGLGCLVNANLIIRYEGNGQRYIAIPTWRKHQFPHEREVPSDIPGPNGELDDLGMPPNEKRRQAIYERDAHRCVYCNRDLVNDVRARCIDHVVPMAKGGTNSDLNLATACKPCNAKKGCRLPTEVGMAWPEGRGEYRQSVNGGLTGGKHGSGKGTDQGTVKRKGTDQGAVLVSALRARFERFWAVYPRKVGKEATWQIWQRRNPDDALTERMIAAVGEQTESVQWQRDGGQFIPHPRTWLHQGREQDGPAPVVRGRDPFDGLRKAVEGG